ncbi:MAG: hypothetical protein CL916_03980 [Deltaproteobacteria bacterium]|nr:hypothetical protein [Deltaproteobacteria bacterium]
MAHDFYDILNITSKASTEDIQNAFRLQTAKLVKRLRVAQDKSADTTIIRDKFKRLRAAKNILVDPMRRKSYDVFKESIEHGIPSDIDVFWSTLKPSMIEPKLSAALKVLQQFTQLPISTLSIIDQAPRILQQESTTIPKIDVIKRKTTVSKPKPQAAQVRTTPLSTQPITGPFTNAQLEELASRIGYGGRFIKTVREHLNISLEGIHKKTHIPIKYLQAIESDSFKQLPSTTFVKGYIQNISKILRIDHMPIVSEYMTLFHNHR